MTSDKEPRAQGAQAKSQEPGPEERKAQPSRPIGEARSLSLEGPDALNQLREILVGAAIRDLERRVARAEAHMAARAHELEEESRRRMEVIESHMRKEGEALSARMERELTQTNESIRALTKEHRETIATAEQRVAKLDDSLVRAQRELRDQLLQQAKRFLDELTRLRHEVTETLERELGVADTAFEQGAYAEERHSAP
ncbi:MAG TPA: hypothetical protein VM686_02865 [Polyangiaceae bacterium]|nr:hypothetical protein [Polyangiaceae bacterium]